MKTATKTPAVIKAEKTMKKALLATLPKRAECPCCKRVKTVKGFGLRCMGRSKDGMPKMFLRQSFCRDCRKEQARKARAAKAAKKGQKKAA